MRFGKALCGITAALTMLSSVAITAQAEETEQLKLLTVKLSDVIEEKDFQYALGGGYFTDSSKFYRIGESELAEWQETGKFALTNIESDFDPSGMEWYSGDFEGEYIQFYKENDDGNVTERQVVHLDKSAGKISKAYTLGSGWCYTTNDGYTVLAAASDVGNGTVSVTVMKPDGTSFTITLKSLVAHLDGAKWDDYVWFKYCAVDDEKYCCYVLVDEKAEGNILDERIYAVYGIGKDGSLTKIVGNINAASSGGIEYASGKNLVVSFAGENYYDIAFSADTGEACRFDYYGSINYCDGKVAIGNRSYDTKNGYDLIDLKTGKTLVNYPYIYGKDKEIFLVNTNDGKWGYIDSNGKELAMFDNASGFDGDYAPVVKDGKVYLIDRNMNKVSDSIDGTDVTTLSDGLYHVAFDDGSAMLVTYAKSSADEPTSSTTTSEPISSVTTSEPTSSATTSEPTSSTVKPGDEIPPTGAALLIPVALLGGAVAVVSRKKRK